MRLDISEALPPSRCNELVLNQTTESMFPTSQPLHLLLYFNQTCKYEREKKTDEGNEACKGKKKKPKGQQTCRGG